jgi:hypothetical protein
MGDVGTNGMGTIIRIFAAGFIDVGRRGEKVAEMHPRRKSKSPMPSG